MTVFCVCLLILPETDLSCFRFLGVFCTVLVELSLEFCIGRSYCRTGLYFMSSHWKCTKILDTSLFPHGNNDRLDILPVSLLGTIS